MAVVLLSCAGQAPPPGGPADTTPPTVIRTEPDTNAVHVQTDRVVLEFSEYVDRRSAEESIFISPYVGLLEFAWSGRELTISFSEELKSDRTYVVNLGTDVVDIRARNRMAAGFTLAFSTGAEIDQGTIGGRVFDDKPEGIMVFAYGLGGIDADTLDPSKTRPDYIVQTGKDGGFAFSNIRFDTYRIIAVQDEYRNLVYDKQIDRFGVATGDVRIDSLHPSVKDLRFRLSAEDTARPFLTKVLPLTRTHLLLRFSEPLDSASFRTAMIRLEDTTSLASVGVMLQSLDLSDSTVATVVTGAPLDSGRAYRLSLSGVVDKAGNPLDSANASGAFVGTATPDTLLPTVHVVGVRDSTTDIPLDASFQVRFSRPVVPLPLQGAITLHDSTKAVVAHTVRWATATSAFLKPDKPLLTKAWYAIQVVMDSARDFSGNKYRDSVCITRFETIDLKTTGVVEGEVRDPDTLRGLGEIVLTLSRISGGTSRTLRLPAPGPFRVEQLPEGLYTLDAYRDADSSRTYTFGKPFPFLPSERFVVYPDTVKVRARWEVEGVSINFQRSSTR